MDVENLYLIYNYQVVINISIFSLIRLNNQEANNELIQRYDTYKNQTPLVGTKTKLKNIFKNIVNYLDENKNIQIDEWEEYAKYFDLNNIHPDLGLGIDAIYLERRTKSPTLLKKVILLMDYI